MNSASEPLEDWTEEEFQAWFDEQVEISEGTSLVEVATLDKYLHDPAATARFVEASASGGTSVSRAPWYPGIKEIDPTEFLAGGHKFFEERGDVWADELRERLAQSIDESTLDEYFDALRTLWVDGQQARQHDPRIVALKASIRDHDRAVYPHRTVFVEERVPDGVDPLFTPDELQFLLSTTTKVMDTCLEEYLASRDDAATNTLGRLFLHRGVFPEKPIEDPVWVEKNYLTSYTKAVSVAELFAQTWKNSKPKTGAPTIVSSEYTTFQNRILAFAPMVPGMSRDQLEVLVAPPLEALPLTTHGTFLSDGVAFTELTYNPAPAGLRWALKVPDRALRPTRS